MKPWVRTSMLLSGLVLIIAWEGLAIAEALPTAHLFATAFQSGSFPSVDLVTQSRLLIVTGVALAAVGAVVAVVSQLLRVKEPNKESPELQRLGVRLGPDPWSRRARIVGVGILALLLTVPGSAFAIENLPAAHEVTRVVLSVANVQGCPAVEKQTNRMLNVTLPSGAFIEFHWQAPLNSSGVYPDDNGPVITNWSDASVGRGLGGPPFVSGNWVFQGPAGLYQFYVWWYQARSCSDSIAVTISVEYLTQGP